MASTPSPVCLIVDDEPMVAHILRDLLEMEGIDSRVFLDAKESLQWFAENHSTVQAIFLDLSMPNMSGSECFKRLRSISPHSKVALMSGYGEDATVKGLMAQGATFFQKPFRWEEVQQWIQSIKDSPPVP